MMTRFYRRRRKLVLLTLGCILVVVGLARLLRNRNRACDALWGADKIRNQRNTENMSQMSKLLNSIKGGLAFDQQPAVRNENTVQRLLYHSSYECPHEPTHPNVSHIHICGDITSQKFDLILFTTMYVSSSNVGFFKNSIRVTASLQQDYNIQAIMFIENARSFTENKATPVIELACSLGWVVLLAPHCNHDGFPVFKSMFAVAMAAWEAEWYGYMNGDMLFDASLLSTVLFMQSNQGTQHIGMLSGRRYLTKVQDNQEICHYRELEELAHRPRLDNGKAIDYFITRKHVFPWRRVPDFVVGRPYYDKWMVWYAQHVQLAVVDVTATVRAVHQSHVSRSYDQNTYLFHRVQDSMDYNLRLGEQLADTDEHMRLVPHDSYLTCLALKSLQLNRRDVTRMLATGRKQIIGRESIYDPDDVHMMAALSENNRTDRRPEVVPLVHEASSHQYALAQRTHYFMYEQGRFMGTDYRLHCHEHIHQHVDLEISELVSL